MRRFTHTLVPLVLLLAACGNAEETTTTTTSASGKPSVAAPDQIPTELVITDLTVGSGRAAEDGDFVVVDYVGVRSEDGLEFDNSYDRGQPYGVTLGVSPVIQGWTLGLLGVQAGGTRRLDIPSELGYGETAMSEIIRENEALSFVVEVRRVIPKAGPEDAPDLSQLEPLVGSTQVTTVDLVKGSGPKLAYGETAVIHTIALRGDTLEELDNSWSRSEPLLLEIAPGPGGWIPGFDRGLADITVGTTRVISIPFEMAYGPDGDPGRGLPAATDLIIVIEVLDVF